MKHQLRYLSKSTDSKKKSRLPHFLIMVIVLLLVLQVVVSNRLATAGMEISEIELNLQKLNDENSDLRQKIASGSSLLTIENKAKETGFVKVVKPIYIAKEPQVAFDLH